ncbi:hypothetical protein ZWY2020_057546 [Hordeum vulgare]|nr:hypothetical protein ZWY2020_057546 [Hordeum vulgare]
MSAPFVAMSVSVVFSAHWVQVSSSSSRRRCAACFSRQSFPSISIRPAPPKRLLNLACSAKQDTIDKVCGIVKKQLAVAQDTLVNGDTKFADLGADSLDTRIKEIVCARSTTPPSSKPATYTTLSIRSTSDGGSVTTVSQTSRATFKVVTNRTLFDKAKEWMVIYLLILQPSPMLSRPLR